ncbi:MAG: polymer-forming cytoskeletal protein [Patescibacteria group bacterium]
MKKFIVFAFAIVSVVASLAQSTQAATFASPSTANQKLLTIDQEINRSLITGGNDITVESIVPKDLISFSDRLTLNNVVNGNLASASGTIYINQSVQGSAVILAQDAIISAPIGGNLYLASQNATIDSEIQGDVFIACKNLFLTKNAHIVGDIYAQASTIDQDSLAVIDGKNAIKQYQQNETSPAIHIGRIIFGLLTLMLLATLIWRFKPKSFDAIQHTMTQKWGTSLLYGFIFLIGTPILSIAILPLVITWPISIIVLVAYCFIIGLSPIFVSYVLANKFLKLKTHPLVAIALGIILLTALKIIPVIGEFISFGALLFGIGAIVILLYEKIKLTKK